VLRYQGEAHVVGRLDGDGTVLLRGADGRLRLVKHAEIVWDPTFRVLDVDNEAAAAEVEPLLDAVPEGAVARARERLEHLQEALTGYRSGQPALAAAGEPRTDYDPDLVPRQEDRFRNKARELRRHRATLFRWYEAYEQRGLAGLVDRRYLQPPRTLRQIDCRLRAAIETELAALANGARKSRLSVCDDVRARVEAEHGGAVPLPATRTMVRYLGLLDRHNVLGRRKRPRNRRNLPETPYRELTTDRPGQVVVIDTTVLDVYAMHPLTFEWLVVHATPAMDLYTRRILALRLTAGPPTAVDAALLLLDMVRPHPLRDQPGSSDGRYDGLPDVIATPLKEDAGAGAVQPDTIVVDGAWVTRSRPFLDGCKLLGASLQIARPFTPTDKAQLERFFLTLGSLLENLPGYKGPDLLSGSDHPERDAFYFTDELERIGWRWIGTVYHPRPHGGLKPRPVPLLHASPNDMLAEGLMRSGSVTTATDASLYYELLPTFWAHVHEYGVDNRTLRYDGDALEPYRGLPSEYGGKARGRWPFKSDPRDLSRIYFYDPERRRWATLTRRADGGDTRPFDDATLAWAKQEVRRRGGNPKKRPEVEQALSQVLDAVRGDLADMDARQRQRAGRSALRLEQAARDRQPTEEPDDNAQSAVSADTGGLPGGLARTDEPADPAASGDEIAFEADLFEVIS
jgi:hypothetical protein